MRIRTKVLIGFTAAALVSGCASSGGGGRVTNADGTASDMTGEDFLLCLLTAGLVCGGKSSNAEEASASTATSNTTSATSSVASSWQPPATFSSWSELDRSRDSMAPAIWAGFTWVRSPLERVSFLAYYETYEYFRYDAQGELHSSRGFSENDKRSSFAPLGHPGIDVLHKEPVYGSPLYGYSRSAFTSLPARGVAAVANPYDLGWDYQSFGVWTYQGSSGDSASAATFGVPTFSGSVPTAGSATFTGKLAAFYLSSTGIGYTAAADLSVQANFTSRSLSVNSSGTTLTRDFAQGTPAPNLNVSGTLSYAAGSNNFNGTLTNAGGTMSGKSQGQFYGPAAQELGGVFTLGSATTTETFVGAYGAKR